MKRCPTCNQTYTDDALSFCLNDGAPLVDASGGAQQFGSGGNIKPPQYSQPSLGGQRDEPQPTMMYTPSAYQAGPSPGWSPTPPPQTPKRKVWPWVAGILGVIVVLGVGLVVLVVLLASLGSKKSNTNLNINSNYNSNSNRAVYNSNSNNSNSSNMNSSNVNSNPSGIYAKSLYMARDDGSGDAGSAVTSFSTTDRTIHCVVTLNRAQAGTKINYKWYVENAGGMTNQIIKEIDYSTGPREDKVDGHLTLQKDWPTGTYRVDAYVNGQLSKSISYSVY